MLALLASLVLGSTLLVTGGTEDAAVIAAQLPTYPLHVCAISGEPLGGMGEPINLVQDGQLVRVCCKGCVKKVAKDPATVLAKIEAAVVSHQSHAYPLKTCIVSGEKLGGEMGDAIDMVVGTRLVRVCCKGCIKKVNREPAKYFAKLDEAYIAAQLADYPLDGCAISGEELVDGEAVNLLYGNQLVRVCCKSCAKKVRANPGPSLAKIAAATPKHGERKGHDGHGHGEHDSDEHGEHDGDHGGER